MTQRQSLGHLLRHQADRMGDRVFLRFLGVDTTFAQVEERTNRLANVLSAHGVRKSDRVAVMLPNGTDFPVAWLAIAKLRAITVPVNVQYNEKDLEYTLNDSGAKFAIAGAEQAQKLTKARSRCRGLQQVGLLGARSAQHDMANLDREIEQAPAARAIDDARCEEVLNLQYTSGTTGLPKACMLAHEYYLLMGKIVADYLRVCDDDVDLTAQPFHYLDPQWNMILCMTAGIPLVILPRFSVSTFWQSVKENGVTFFYVVGTMPIYLLKQPVNEELERNHKLRVVVCSGIVPQLHATFESRWNVPWREAYGTTETGVDLVVPLEDAASVGSGAMGKPVFSKEAKVVDSQCNEVLNGKPGELLVRGKPMMLGYYNKPEATAEKIRNGWLHTGDLVFRDQKGYFQIVGRLKDMIRRGGENISAAEVEGVLCEHSAVQAAAAVALPDEALGEEVKVFVQLQPGETIQTAPPDVLLEFVRGKLAAFKVPRYLEYVDDFPRTPSERIAKYELLKAKQDQRIGAFDAATGRWN